MLGVQVCLAAVGLVGDLCRVLSAKIEPSCRELLEAMVVALVVSFCARADWSWLEKCSLGLE